MDTHNGAKVYVYTRVSTTSQVDGYSLDAQMEKMKAYANFQNMKIVKEYSDEGISGKNIENRSQFKQMLKDIEAKKDGVSFVLVFKLSRFGRNAADTLASLQMMQDYGVNLISVEEGLDSSEETGKLMISIMAAMAEMERENILVQSMAGRRQKATEGGWNGGFAPYGYQLINGKIEIVEEEAEIVKRIFHMFVEDGLGAVGVSKRLNAEGIKKKIRQKNDIDTFSAHFIKLVLDNPIYMGKIAYGRRKNEKIEGKRNQYHVVKEKNEEKIIMSQGQHEAIVSEEIWYRAQAKRKETGYKREKVEKEHEYILSGLVVCPSCGKRMYGIPSRKKKKDGTYYPTYYAYACRQNGNQTGHKCQGQRQINCAEIDKEVENVIIHHMWSEEAEKALAEQLSKNRNVEELEKQLKAYNETLKKYDIQIKKMEQQQDSLDVFDDNYDSLFESYSRRLSDVFTKRAELKKIAHELELKITAINTQTVSEEKALDMLMSFGQNYATLSDSQKKKFMNTIIDSIDIFPQRTDTGFVKTIHLRVPLDFYGQMTDTIDMKEYLANPDWIDIPDIKISSVEDLIAFEKTYGVELVNRQQILDMLAKKQKQKEVTIELDFSSVEEIDNFEKQYQCKFSAEDRKMMEKAIRETGHFPPKETPVETVVLLSQQHADDYIDIELDLEEFDLTSAESKASYREIKEYIFNKYNTKVSTLYIAQIKRKCGIELGINYNPSKKENARVPICPLEKEKLILDALTHFQMI